VQSSLFIFKNTASVFSTVVQYCSLVSTSDTNHLNSSSEKMRHRFTPPQK